MNLMPFKMGFQVRHISTLLKWQPEPFQIPAFLPSIQNVIIALPAQQTKNLIFNQPGHNKNIL